LYIDTFSFFSGITGATIRLDQNGDSEGNFSVLAFKPYNFSINNFTCDYHMVPVGQFQQVFDGNALTRGPVRHDKIGTAFSHVITAISTF